MKINRIIILVIVALTTSASYACTFKVLNNSNYETIWLVANENMANEVSYDTFVNMQSEQIVKVKKQTVGAMHGKWFYVYTPMPGNSMFIRHFKVASRFCMEDEKQNKLSYKAIEQRQINMDRFEVIDYTQDRVPAHEELGNVLPGKPSVLILPGGKEILP